MANKTITVTKKVRKWGQSLVIAISQEKKALNLKDGDWVKITIETIKEIK